MSFGFLPSPVFLAVVFGFSILLIIYATKIYKSEGKLLSTGYSLIGASGLCAVLVRIIHEYFNAFKNYVWMIKSVLGILLIVGFALIAFVGWQKTKENQKIRKLYLVSLGTIMLSISIVVIVVIVFGLKY